jgi:uncharacterized protein YqgV (UPF0045/DUF77 family)
MNISVEISYYPLVAAYGPAVSEFISRLRENPDLQIVPGGMSTVLIGGYDEVFRVLKNEIRGFMEKYPSVFTLKIANSCPV